ncbi:MAG: hypothetical protein MR494_03595 [Spirochaetia bacterium]|nr:hypothetical protein [Spirochaetia bacterium]
MEDNTGEFWRTRFVELQKINMRAAGRERMNMETAPALIKEFEEKNPGVNSKVTVNETNVDWEIILSAELKMRFFVQNQVKGSIMQKVDAGFVKLADAKFYSNPIPEIQDFVEKFSDMQQEFSDWKIQGQKYGKLQKITGELIKAIVMDKIKGQNIQWQLETDASNFVLLVEKNGERKEYQISMADFVSEVEKIEF